MALAEHFPAIFLLVSLFISHIVVDARESQFFSKVTNTNNNNNNNNVVNVQETQSTNKQETQVNNLNKQETKETEPTFIPNKNGYGLYDHGTGQLPPEATATTTATTLYSDPNKYNNNNYEEKYNTNNYEEKYNNNNYEEKYNSNYNNNYEEKYNNDNYEQQYNNNNNNYYKKDSYVTEAEQEQLGGARLQQTDNYATVNNQNSYYTTGGNRYSSNNGFQKEGMSDTRFMENGKYYYDVNNEEKYNPKYNNYANNRNYNTNNYNNNNNNNGYNTNNYNNNGYYQNKNQEEFQETEDEFSP